MVKVRTIVRIPQLLTKETSLDRPKQHKNLESSLHPLQKAREFKRALNAAKLERVFAKPLVKALADHTDSVFSLSTSDQYLTKLVSGSCNGEVKLWDLSTFKCEFSTDAHSGFVTGLSFRNENFISTGRDNLIKLWNLQGGNETFHSSMGLNGVDMARDGPFFVTCGEEGVDLWDMRRSHPVSKFEWTDSTLKSRYNPNEGSLVGATSNDRSIRLIDIRANTVISQTILAMKSNDLAWNPREPMYFTVANENSCLYSFDMRKLDSAYKIYKDHLSPVTSVSFSPTGREFASGSFDKTVRIFDVKDGRSREIYHAKRMQWIYAVVFSGDGKFVLTGSDDTNIRVWKSRADAPLKQLTTREQEAVQYREKLKKMYRDVPEVKRILRHRHLPKFLYRMKQRKQEMKESEFRKETNRMAHTRPENIRKVHEREKIVLDNN